MEPEDLRKELMFDQLHHTITRVYMRLRKFSYEEASGMASTIIIGIRSNYITLDSVIRVMLERNQGEAEHHVYTMEDVLEELEKELGG